MMFRQICVRDEDVHLQRVLWSATEDELESHYVPLTMTYGEASAPYLALITLLQLCKDEGVGFPEAVDAIRRDLYVDNFLTGGDSMEAARIFRDQIIQLLMVGGLPLKKHVSNDRSLLEDLPSDDLLRTDWMHFTTDGPVSELGIAWDPEVDSFRFAAPKPGESKTLTKRRVLAEMAGLWDPVSWLAPVTVSGKMIIQDLWKAKLSWDEPLPTSYATCWAKFRSNLANVGSLALPRWFQSAPNSGLQLHAFADAS
ncbi:uncharacterized protein LOC106638273 [Copidosoma floridanum]|uniref:uncharacterized protein LOC106638273 n=1 Tax=Copidosoma floridanum TaxID=29053 RepID=UPI0006C94748|nr:uncharacterized protein LOC106638273 [Copidosoma floridanum]